MARTTIVIVEDEPLIALDLKSLCEGFGYRVLGIARSASEARARFRDLRPDILLTDMELGNGSDGADVAAMMRKFHASIQVIFVTGARAQEKIQRMRQAFPKTILSKPVQEGALRSALRASGA